MSRAEVLQIVAALAGAFATIVSAAEQRLVKRLRRAGATVQDGAIRLDGLAPILEWRLSRLLGAGAVVRVEQDAFILDETGYRAFRKRRRQRALLLVVVGLGLVAVMVLAR